MRRKWSYNYYGLVLMSKIVKKVSQKKSNMNKVDTISLFELRSEHLYTKISVPLKDMEVERGVNIILMNNLNKTEIALTCGSKVTVPLPYIDVFAEMGVAQFIHETKMVGKLMLDIKEIKSVRDRWLPNFVGNIEEIENVLNSQDYFRVSRPEVMGTSLFAYTPRTIGQYLLLAMCERLRKRIKKGINLKTMLYLLSLITRFAKDGNYDALSLLLHNAVVWITQSTCDDCLIKTMRYLHGQRTFEYSYHLSDSFSKYIKFQAAKTLNMSISMRCSRDGIVEMTDEQRRCFLRTMGTHAYLVSPEAGKRISVLIRYSDDYPENKIFPTGRELVSLLSVMDLHARVLRAHDWNQSVSAFNAWWSERRGDLTENSAELLSLMIDDLISLRRHSREMKACTTHLICLLTKGVLQREMISNYNSRGRQERAHEFLVRFVFYVVPTPSLAAFAEMYFKRFEGMSPEDRRLEISFTLENSKHSYALCPAGTIGPVSRRLRITNKERILYAEEREEDERPESTAKEEADEDGLLGEEYDLEPLPLEWEDDVQDRESSSEEELRCDQEEVKNAIVRLNLRISDTEEAEKTQSGPSNTSTEYMDFEEREPRLSISRASNDVFTDWNSIIEEEAARQNRQASTTTGSSTLPALDLSEVSTGLSLNRHQYEETQNQF